VSKETPQLKGELTIIVKRRGKVIAKRTVKNIITKKGKEAMAGLLLADVPEAAYEYIAIGTGTTTPTKDDTTLEFETHRVAGDGILVTTTDPNDTAQLKSVFSGYTGTEAITESGLFNDGTAGDMLARQTFAAINVDWDAGDSVEITWKIQFK